MYKHLIIVFQYTISNYLYSQPSNNQYILNAPEFAFYREHSIGIFQQSRLCSKYLLPWPHSDRVDALRALVMIMAQTDGVLILGFLACAAVFNAGQVMY